MWVQSQLQRKYNMCIFLYLQPKSRYCSTFHSPHKWCSWNCVPVERFVFFFVSFLCNLLMFIAVITPAEVDQSSSSGQACAGALPVIVEEQAALVLMNGGKYHRQELSHCADSGFYVQIDLFQWGQHHYWLMMTHLCLLHLHHWMYALICQAHPISWCWIIPASKPITVGTWWWARTPKSSSADSRDTCHPNSAKSLSKHYSELLDPSGSHYPFLWNTTCRKA